MQASQSAVTLATVSSHSRNRPNRSTFAAQRVQPIVDVVYLVGSDAFLRDQISTCLASTQTKLISFQSANEFLDFEGVEAASCVVIDSNLEDMCGLEFQCRLAARSKPPVIFISDLCEVSLTVCAMKAGAIDFLSKPLDLSALMAGIQAGLAHDRRHRLRKTELARLLALFNRLTPREREVLPLVIGGLLNKQAASHLGISEVTLQIHRSQVMRKMEADSVPELVRMAIKLRIPHWCEGPPQRRAKCGNLREAPGKRCST